MARGDGALVVGVDCSTTAAKAVVFDAAGRAVASASIALRTSSPHPGWHEQDAESWWSGARAAIAAAVADSGRAADVAAVCTTHQRESFVCLDPSGRPLRPAVLWLDGRATEQISDLGTPEVELLCGKPADITPALYKLAWLARHEPDVLRRSHKVADAHGFLVHRMTGRWTTSVSSADPLALLDVVTGDYADALLQLAGVRREQMLDLQPAGSTIGELLPALAAEWGLRPGVAVVAGLGDGQAAGVGAGVLRLGRAYLNLGTAVLLGTEQTGYAPSRSYRSLASVIAGNTTLEAFLSAGNYLPTWFRRTFGRRELQGRPDADLDAAAAALPPGSDRLVTVPYWNTAQTPHWDPLASGAIVGWRSVHTPAHMYRSLLEGVAFEVRGQLDGLERSTGTRLDSIRGMGGGSRSQLWRQITADVLERPVELCAEPEVSALGAAIVGFTALGVHRTLDEATASMTSTGGVIEPEPRASAAYRELAAVHGALYAALRPSMHDLTSTGAPAPRRAEPR